MRWRTLLDEKLVPITRERESEPHVDSEPNSENMLQPTLINMMPEPDDSPDIKIIVK